MRPVKARAPGRGSGRNIPSGVLLGRLPGAGKGDVQLLQLGNLQSMGIATQVQIQQQFSRAGFGFFDSGVLPSGLLLGSGVWARNVVFGGAGSSYTITSLIPAAATAVFHIYALPGGVPTLIATITFSAGSKVGVLAWTSPPYTLIAGTSLQLYAPSPADTQLASVSGLVNGQGQ